MHPNFYRERRDWKFIDVAYSMDLDLRADVKNFTHILPTVLDEIRSVAGIAQLQKTPTTPPMFRPKSFLKRLIYQLTCHTFYFDLHQVLFEELSAQVRLKGGRVGATKSDDPHYALFRICLRAVPPTRFKFSGGELSSAANSMVAARAFGVHHSDLIGWTYQYGRYAHPDYTDELERLRRD